jgi:energy-converting hydrogenase Eha subunit A
MQPLAAGQLERRANVAAVAFLHGECKRAFLAKLTFKRAYAIGDKLGTVNPVQHTLGLPTVHDARLIRHDFKNSAIIRANVIGLLLWII